MGSPLDFKPERLDFANNQNQRPDVEDNIQIGEGTKIGQHVVLKGRVRIGRNCVIKSNTVIGEDGFGMAYDHDGVPHRIKHTGGVVIGDNVEIGSLNTVCRGTVQDTVIANNVKTDDHIHIAHNCKIGENTVITAGAIFGGSVTTGKNCWFGLNSSIMNGITLGDRTVVGMGAVVLKNTEPDSVMVGNPAKNIKKAEPLSC